MSNSPTNEDIEQTRLVLGIGECIIAWSNLEHKLADIFTDLVSGEGPPLYYVWYSIISFEARMKCLNTACQENIRDEDLIFIWNKLSNKIGKRVRKRNQLAHSTLIESNKLAPYYDGDPFNGKQITLTVKDVLNIRDSFFELEEAVNWLYYQLHFQRYEPEEMPPAPDLVRQIQKTGGLIPEEK